MLHYLLAMLFNGQRETDLNHLDNLTAVRFYCEYKIQVQIHRHIADWRLLAIPASWGRLQTSIRIEGPFDGISSALPLCDPL